MEAPQCDAIVVAATCLRGSPPRPVGAQNFGEAPKAFLGGSEGLREPFQRLLEWLSKAQGRLPKVVGATENLAEAPQCDWGGCRMFGGVSQGHSAKSVGEAPKAFCGDQAALGSLPEVA